MSWTAARSLLFVPGDRPERFAKALATGADLVVIDLEDAVLPNAKDVARRTVREWLSGAEGQNVAVRVNAPGTLWHDDDMDVVAGARHVVALVLPKADNRDTLEASAARLAAGQNLIALVETVQGYLDVRRLVFARGLSRIAFGSVDFSSECGIRGLGSELDPVRVELVVASRAAGIMPPIEGVTIAVADSDLLSSDIDRARRLGFGGKLCIHPSQVEAVNRGFSPSAEELDWARRVLEASGAGGAVTVDGKLVDKPVVEQASRLLGLG